VLRSATVRGARGRPIRCSNRPCTAAKIAWRFGKYLLTVGTETLAAAAISETERVLSRLPRRSIVASRMRSTVARACAARRELS